MASTAATLEGELKQLRSLVDGRVAVGAVLEEHHDKVGGVLAEPVGAGQSSANRPPKGVRPSTAGMIRMKIHRISQLV